MAKTVAEVLKESGLTDEQVAAIDAKAMEGLTRVLTSANEAEAKAANDRRLMNEQYDRDIAPALAKWGESDTRLSTENAAMRTFIDKVKDGGYLPAEVIAAMPKFGETVVTPGARGADGKFVASPSATPGAVDEKKIREDLNRDLGGAFRFSADTQWKYRSLFGTEMPDSPTALIAEARANRMEPSAWAAQKYKFAEKEASIAAEKQKAHDDGIRKEVSDAKDKEWAEKLGNNPDHRLPRESEFSSVSKAVAEGKRKDPLKMSPEERKSNTHANIQKEFSDRASATVH